MKPRLIILLLILILLPLALLFILGFTMIDQEQQYIKEQFRGLLLTRLLDIKKDLNKIIEGHSLEFQKKDFLLNYDSAAIRRWLRSERMIKQIFIKTSGGKIIHPPEEESRTIQEKQFFARTDSIWQDGESFYTPWEDSHNRIQTHGWYSWFWGKGINIIFWQRDIFGTLTGLEVDRTALIADIIGSLPDSSRLEPELYEGRVVLRDVMEKTIYQWGIYQPGEEEEPLLRLPVEEPLNGWELLYFPQSGSMDSYFKKSTMVSSITALIVTASLFIAMALYFFRENSRAIREAARKVTFVNQVSHELKTPLTNIRLYAELLENRIDPGDEKAESYLKVITSESRRLSRMILNVLTFGRDKKKEIKVKLSRGIIDESINSVMENFGHSFKTAGIKCLFYTNAKQPVLFDEDIVKQILNNLLSNVEKYAAGGGEIRIDSRNEGDFTFITISDKGPGIPGDQRKRIFKPFVRISNRLTDGVSGTGLGLTIARRLSMAHGGNVTLENRMEGAGFTISLKTPPPPERNGV